MDKIYLTKAGYDKLKGDLDALKKRRPELARAIGEARDHGDISENAEYDAAKNEQGMNELRIADLEDKLSRCAIIDESRMPKDEVLIGATVHLAESGSQEPIVYTIVSDYEADFARGKISINSPVGKGLMNRKLGEQVEISVPAGVLKYKIAKIERR